MFVRCGFLASHAFVCLVVFLDVHVDVPQWTKMFSSDMNDLHYGQYAAEQAAYGAAGKMQE